MNAFEYFLWCLVAMGAGAGFFALGVHMGKQKARIEDKLQALTRCNEASENPFTPMGHLSCPCQCGGILFNIGKNRANTHTALECDKCRCAYVAHDRKEAA